MNRKRNTGILLGVLILLLSGCTGNIGSEPVAPTTEPPMLQITEAKSETLTEEKPDMEAAAEPETESECESESESETESEPETETETEESDTFDLALIPEYSGMPYTELNDNIPLFQESDFQTKSFESYSELDQLGRCGVAFANIGEDLMPTEPRGEIGAVHPSGWHTINYHELIDGNYLYNRCHLIAYQLTGENANEKNLITGTRYIKESNKIYSTETREEILKNGYEPCKRCNP